MLKRGLSLCLIAVLLIGLFAAVPMKTHAASDMVTSEECIAVIKEFEGFSGSAYLDTDGLYTIGYGTRCPTDMVEYYKTYPMTKEEADAELRRCVVEYEAAVNKFLDKHGITFTQGQFDGVISMVYNCGASWLNKGSTLISALTSGATGNELIYAFTIYSMSGGVRSVGHINRRLAEANMYLNGEYQRKAPEAFGYVIYNGNGGKVSTYDVQGYDVNLTAKPIPTATRDGYVFQGWYTAASGGQKVTVLNASTDGVKLYAHWERASVKPTEPSEPTTPGGDKPDTGDTVEAVLVEVTGSNVNVRKGPGLGYSVVTSVTKGDKLNITATAESDGLLWGQYEQGWVALKYTNYDDVIAQKPSEPEKPEEPVTVTKTYGTVIKTDTLNVRTEPDGEAIGVLYLGDRVEILEQGMYNGRLWGRFEGGWICMRTYVSLETVTETVSSVHVEVLTEPKDQVIHYGTVVNTKTQNVRVAPDGGIVGKLYNGERLAIYEKKMVNGRMWGRIDMGWVCMRTYIRLDSEESAAENVDSNSMMVTASCLNVRSGAGTEHNVVSRLFRGTSVVVLEQVEVNGRMWARIDMGWVCMDYLV